MPDFINTEHCVEKLFPVGTTFSFEGKKYQVALCGKPRPARGECKTDVYILSSTYKCNFLGADNKQ